MSTVGDNLRAVRARLDAACHAAGRDPSQVHLVAVSKVHPASAIELAQAVGQVDFGESYAQELRDKAALVAPPVRWHFIGRVQTNKARYIAPVAFRVHALENVHQAEALLARAPDGVDALLSVHVGGEESKSGVEPDEVLSRVRELSALPGLRVRGLMCLPPYRDDPEQVAPYFAQVQALLHDCQADGHAMDELSMGMTHDFEVAVRFGATWVRVGTAIFGERPKSA